MPTRIYRHKVNIKLFSDQRIFQNIFASEYSFECKDNISISEITRARRAIGQEYCKHIHT